MLLCPTRNSAQINPTMSATSGAWKWEKAMATNGTTSPVKPWMLLFAKCPVAAATELWSLERGTNKQILYPIEYAQGVAARRSHTLWYFMGYTVYKFIALMWLCYQFYAHSCDLLTRIHGTASLPVGQYHDCPSVDYVTLKDSGK